MPDYKHYHTHVMIHKPKSYTEAKPEEDLIQFIMSGGHERVVDFLDNNQFRRYITHNVHEYNLTEPSDEIKRAVAEQEEWLRSFIKTEQFNGRKHQFYRKFRIPKAKGGFREITAPNDRLKAIQTGQKEFIEHVLKVLPHNATHAYTQGRGIKTNAMVHQHSRYFLNIDMKDFFPSHNKQFVMKMLGKVYPLMYFPNYVKLLVDIAELNNGLPQGTPLSPLLTNLCCVELDYRLTERVYKWYADREGTKAIVHYTRYADDCTFSSVHHFNHHDILHLIRQTLKD